MSYTFAKVYEFKPKSADGLIFVLNRPGRQARVKCRRALGKLNGKYAKFRGVKESDLTDEERELKLDVEDEIYSLQYDFVSQFTDEIQNLEVKTREGSKVIDDKTEALEFIKEHLENSVLQQVFSELLNGITEDEKKKSTDTAESSLTTAKENDLD